MSSLATVRDSLVIAYSQNIIDDVEFALLYDANMSKPVFPYSKYDIHVDIQIWYPGLGKTQLNFALSSTQHLISFTYDIDIDCKIGGGGESFPSTKGYAQVCRGHLPAWCSTPELFWFHRWNCTRNSPPKIQPVSYVHWTQKGPWYQIPQYRNTKWPDNQS